MEVDWDSEICGIRLIKIRDLLRRVRGREFDVDWVAAHLRASDAVAKGVMVELLDRRWIEVVESSSVTNPQFQRTSIGHSLAAAKAIPRITRARAEQILRGFMKRVHEVNDDDDFGVFVDEVYVFGSFIDPSKERLGDLDLIVGLPMRKIIGRQFSKYEQQRQRAAGAEGWFSGFLTYEVDRYLKARDPHISFGSIAILEQPIPRSLIYEAPDEVRREHAHRGGKNGC